MPTVPETVLTERLPLRRPRAQDDAVATCDATEEFFWLVALSGDDWTSLRERDGRG